MGRALDHAYPALFEAYAFNNIIINGGMSVSQELGSGPTTLVNNGSKYICDQWRCEYSHAAATAVFTGSAQPTGGPAYGGSYLELKATTLSAMAGAGDYAYIIQPIEGYRAERLGYGVAAAVQSVVVGFYVWTTVTGTATVAIRNSAANRSYLANFTVNNAATWEYKTVVIPGDSTGTWLVTSGVGLYLSFCFGGGTTFNGTNVTWNAGNFFKTSSTTNFFGTNANRALISNVTLMPGSEAALEARAPLLQRSYDQELLLCKRYFNIANVYLEIPVSSGSDYSVTANFPTMRATPTSSASDTTSTNLGAPTAVTATSASTVFYRKRASGTGACVLNSALTLDARL